MRHDRKDLPEIADEYVLGLLEPSAQAEVEAAMERDAALRAAVAASRERFLPLDTAVEPAAVDEGLWGRIEAALPTAPAIPAGRSVSAGSSPSSNDNRPRAWRATALSALAASLLLAVGLAWSLTRTVEPLVIAVLLNETGEAQAVVEDFGNDTAKVRLLNEFAVPADKTIQVWTLPSREMGPVSLGLVRGSQSAVLQAPALPRPRRDQLYELTLEQAGGSPTGRPTGPILAKGFARRPL
ncbi:anti-sigma factor [Azospirillum doebereinerae]|uniref:Anti-sigma factor n=1 Tax=Azospirillum doebereinerae TaxID=92933 RepID=A0A433J0Y8_9PROT|nr:anti-sigma factor [Azospirillum doebereinerae]MCG5240500.1 anti-sigma factor [Azospirillum doebereinerae]RUQ63697.1 anti-sigma factor [Azospirillum doebereinerae]